MRVEYRKAVCSREWGKKGERREEMKDGRKTDYKKEGKIFNL